MCTLVYAYVYLGMLLTFYAEKVMKHSNSLCVRTTQYMNIQDDKELKTYNSISIHTHTHRNFGCKAFILYKGKENTKQINFVTVICRHICEIIVINLIHTQSRNLENVQVIKLQNIFYFFGEPEYRLKINKMLSN